MASAKPRATASPSPTPPASSVTEALERLEDLRPQLPGRPAAVVDDVADDAVPSPGRPPMTVTTRPVGLCRRALSSRLPKIRSARADVDQGRGQILGKLHVHPLPAVGSASSARSRISSTGDRLDLDRDRAGFQAGCVEEVLQQAPAAGRPRTRSSAAARRSPAPSRSRRTAAGCSLPPSPRPAGSAGRD